MSLEDGLGNLGASIIMVRVWVLTVPFLKMFLFQKFS